MFGLLGSFDTITWLIMFRLFITPLMHGLSVRSCSEGHQVSASWGQCMNLCNISKLSTEVFTPRKREQNVYPTLNMSKMNV